MSLKTARRVIAIIMIAQGGITPVVNFVLIRPVMSAPGFLTQPDVEESRVVIPSERQRVEESQASRPRDQSLYQYDCDSSTPAFGLRSE